MARRLEMIRGPVDGGQRRGGRPVQRSHPQQRVTLRSWARGVRGGGDGRRKPLHRHVSRSGPADRQAPIRRKGADYDDKTTDLLSRHAADVPPDSPHDRLDLELGIIPRYGERSLAEVLPALLAALARAPRGGDDGAGVPCDPAGARGLAAADRRAGRPCSCAGAARPTCGASRYACPTRWPADRRDSRRAPRTGQPDEAGHGHRDRPLTGTGRDHQCGVWLCASTRRCCPRRSLPTHARKQPCPSPLLRSRLGRGIQLQPYSVFEWAAAGAAWRRLRCRRLAFKNLGRTRAALPGGLTRGVTARAVRAAER